VGPILRELMDSAVVQLELPRTRRTDAGQWDRTASVL
jgi:hypothetical protein